MFLVKAQRDVSLQHDAAPTAPWPMFLQSRSCWWAAKLSWWWWSWWWFSTERQCLMKLHGDLLASGSKQQCDSKWRSNWGWWRGEQAADEEQGQREEEGEGRGRRVASCSWTVPGCFPGNKVGISTHWKNILRIKSQLKCSEPFDGNIFAQGSEFCPRHLKCRSCPCCHQIMFIRWE